MVPELYNYIFLFTLKGIKIHCTTLIPLLIQYIGPTDTVEELLATIRIYTECLLINTAQNCPNEDVIVPGRIVLYHTKHIAPKLLLRRLPDSICSLS